MKKLLFFLLLIPVLSFGQTDDYTTTSRSELDVLSVHDKTLSYSFYDTLSGSNDTLIISFPTAFPVDYTATLGSTWLATGTTTDSDVFLQGRNASHETWADLGTTTFAEETTTAYSSGIDVGNYLYYRLVCVSASGTAHLKNTLVLKKKVSSSSGVIKGTYTAIQSLVTNSMLKPGRIYEITDRGDRGLVLIAITNDEFSYEVTRKMLCPTTYLTTGIWKGIWQSTLTPSSGDLVIWGAYVWENQTGAVGTSVDDFTLDATNWTVVSKSTFTNGEYTEIQFSANYDFDNDWIGIQWDEYGNVFGKPFNGDPGEDNYADHSDWNWITKDASFRKNKMDGFVNNIGSNIHDNVLYGYTMRGNIVSGSIDENILTGDMTYNVCQAIQFNQCGDDIANNTISGSITLNKNHGSIESNILTDCDISYNSNNGDISSNTGSGNINYNSSLGNISGNSCEGGITYNDNAGDIDSNAHDGGIFWNKNNGSIMNCTGSGGFNVTHNTNNGDIDNPAGLAAADVTDTVVNK